MSGPISGLLVTKTEATTSVQKVEVVRWVLQCRQFYLIDQVVMRYWLAEQHFLYAQLALAKTYTAVQ